MSLKWAITKEDEIQRKLNEEMIQIKTEVSLINQKLDEIKNCLVTKNILTFDEEERDSTEDDTKKLSIEVIEV